ncbi:restriction endonuclease subunit S [Flavobacteriales bacterium]|nr:restriction endonuclease subunit S [Flavobacteriales bacterium]
MNLNVDKSQWTKVRLGDVATEYSSRINDPSSGDRERFVGSSCIGQWDFRVQEWESTESVTSAMKLFEEGDYLLVRRSLYASDFRERAPRAHFAGVCSGDILTIRENPELIADGFLIGILNNPSIWSYIVANASGSITRRIKWKDLANYEFLLPPKDQQAEIAELLWALEDSNEIYLGIEKKMSGLESAVSRQAFPMDRTELLGDLATLYSGGTPSRKVPEYWGGDIPWVKTTEVDYSEITVTEESITALGLKESAAKLVRSGTILMAMYGQGVTRGRVSILGIDASCNQACAVIEVKDKEIVDWVYFFLKFSYDSIRGLAQGAIQENLNLGLIRDIQIPIIERNKMVTTTNILKQIVSAKIDLEKCSEDLKATRLSLIAGLF